MSTGPGTGTVTLVGGGPGAPDLITLRGHRALQAADVVLADRLGTEEILAQLPPEVEVVDVGKQRGRHVATQDRINDLLVELATSGRDAVRLKGGDPFVLGRGGEEVLHCARHGIPVTVVPGLTSAVSVPAAAGIPVTHRGTSTSFVVASAHDGSGRVAEAVIAAHPSTTLVLLMGVRSLEETAARLVAAGRDPATPVAIIESGWTPRQRTTRTTLAAAAGDAARVGVGAPAVIVVGEVVRIPAQVADALAAGVAAG